MSSLFGVTSVALKNLTCSSCGKGFHAAVFGANSAGGASIICPSCNALVTELVFANDFHSRGYSSPAESDESLCMEADYAGFC
ncbi:MAG: hypothetical protein ACTFAL_10560 [Candidatus Electronema sp. V4]|uniref:hypothetical protein n=1 Tax=Candidatus Electronema sp. V4 TaxID=3454756 RepID=UPI004055615A